MDYLGRKKFYELRWVAKQFAEQQLHNNCEQVKTAQIDSVLYMANWICRMLAYSTMWAGHWHKMICRDCGWTWLHALLNCAEFFHFVPTLESTAGTTEGESEAVEIIGGTSRKKVYVTRVMDYTQHLKDFSFLQYHKILSLESVSNLTIWLLIGTTKQFQIQCQLSNFLILEIHHTIVQPCLQSCL